MQPENQHGEATLFLFFLRLEAVPDRQKLRLLLFDMARQNFASNPSRWVADVSIAERPLSLQQIQTISGAGHQGLCEDVEPSLGGLAGDR